MQTFLSISATIQEIDCTLLALTNGLMGPIQDANAIAFSRNQTRAYIFSLRHCVVERQTGAKCFLNKFCGVSLSSPALHPNC